MKLIEMNLQRTAIGVVIVLCLLPLLASCRQEKVLDEETELSLQRLDMAIERFDDVKAETARQTDSIKRQLATALQQGDSGSNRVYGIYEELFRRYLYTDADSAIRYAGSVIESSRDTLQRVAGWYDLAKAYITKGHDADAFMALEETFPDTGNLRVKPLYYDLMIFRKNMIDENPVRWFRRLLRISSPGSEAHVISEAFLYGEEGNPAKGADIIERFIDTGSGSPQFRAVACLTKGRLQLQASDTVKAIKSLAEAARLDLTLPTFRYRALGELSLILARTRDYRRAYRYIHFANDNINDARIFGDIAAVNGIMSDVVKAYEANQQRERKTRIVLICILSAVSVMLVISIFLVRKSHARTKEAKERLSEANTLLSESNTQLSEANAELTEAHARMKEIDNVKSAYLIEYMRQCAVHIDSLDRFRATLQAIARSKGLKGVEEFLRKNDSSSELREFYASFDRTFLRLFPDFIVEFNKLLKPGCQTALSSDGTMPNELRAFALIRLGITDSSRIAEFLRRSVTTVYNYRVKMRNNALCPREDFEKKVAEIHSAR